MQSRASEKALVAVDLGAQSCRVSLLRWGRGAPECRVVHRFANAPVPTGSGLRWDMMRIFAGVMEGLRLCAEAAPEGIASVGVDGWAVDYVRLGPDGKAIEDPYCYRDPRSSAAMKEVYRLISPEKLYSLTGIQLISLNTIFQLYADKMAGLGGARWLNLPEYVTYLLGGKPVAEYTNATHTQLVTLGKQEWCREIFEVLGLDRAAAPELVPTGTIVGALEGDLRQLPAFRDTQLLMPACHDTASAIAAIPGVGDDWAFISSGTWSLVGTVLPQPCVSDEAYRMNFTNLGGAGGGICFLKNVNGMWLLRQCMDQWARAGRVWSLDVLLPSCKELAEPEFLIDVDDPELMVPGDLPAAINGQLRRAGWETIAADDQGIPKMANLIFHSLAERYAQVLESVSRVTGKKLKRLFIVGGGAKNAFLNDLTAKRAGVTVRAGCTEASTIGNFAIQMARMNSGMDGTSSVNAPDVAKYAEILTCSLSPVSVE